LSWDYFWKNGDIRYMIYLRKHGDLMVIWDISKIRRRLALSSQNQVSPAAEKLARPGTCEDFLTVNPISERFDDDLSGTHVFPK